MNAIVAGCWPFVDLLKVEGLTEAESIDPSVLYTDVRISACTCTCTLPIVFYFHASCNSPSLISRRLCLLYVC